MENVEKLQRDLTILEAMAAEMDEYLRSDVLFWPMRRGEMPRLTLGGYLMRQHLLLALRDQLDEQTQARLQDAVDTYQEALGEKVVRFEQKAHEELEARLRQWQEYLSEVKRGSGGSYYASSVETRAIIEALIRQLRQSPYRLQDRIQQRLNLLDRDLRRYFEPGEFIWHKEYQEAYPREEYWWLYGQPKQGRD